MRKLLAIALAFAIFAVACKKAEEKPSETKTGTPAAKSGQQKPTKQKGNQTVPVAQSLEIFNESTLISTVAMKDIASLATNKIKAGKAGAREVNAVLLSDLLQKYNVTGKNVILSGKMKSVTLTWDQATKGQIYIYEGLKGQVQVSVQSQELRDLNIPGQLVKVTVSEKAEAAAVAKPPKK